MFSINADLNIPFTTDSAHLFLDISLCDRKWQQGLDDTIYDATLPDKAVYQINRSQTTKSINDMYLYDIVFRKRRNLADEIQLHIVKLFLLGCGGSRGRGDLIITALGLDR